MSELVTPRPAQALIRLPAGFAITNEQCDSLIGHVGRWLRGEASVLVMPPGVPLELFGALPCERDDAR